MPCNLSRKDVSRIVLGVIRRIHGNPSIVEANGFGAQGINADAQFRTGYFADIRDGVAARLGCSTRTFSPGDCENAETVADIVNAVFDDLTAQNENA